jgi:hypothetical protein
MTPHNIRPLLLLFALLGISSASGQASDSNVLENEDLANARALLQAGRAEIIRDELFMTEDESADFWPVYEEYHAEIMTVRDRQTMIVTEFLKGNRAGTLDNDYAEDFTKNNFEIRSDLLKIQEKYIRRFHQILPALKVARFYQLESQMDAQVDARLTVFVPLIEVM